MYVYRCLNVCGCLKDYLGPNFFRMRMGKAVYLRGQTLKKKKSMSRLSETMTNGSEAKEY